MTMQESKLLSFNPYPFKAPETFRMQWASENDRLEHSHIISNLSILFQTSELSSVQQGRRKSCIVHKDLGELVSNSPFVSELESHGCRYKVLGYTAKSDTYSNETKTPKSMLDTQARLLVYREIPDMTLGYPVCCQAFFKQIWEDEGHRDTIPFQLGFENPIVNYHPYCNVMLKGLGLRAVPHLPCSMHCKETIKFASTFLVDYTTEELELLNYYLNLETEFSCYHGYAEVKTKHFKLLFNSVATGSKYLTTIKPLIKLLKKSENGFVSIDAERAAHMKIMEVLRPFFHNQSGTVIDFGCGDGTLLSLIKSWYPAYVMEGIEINERKAGLAAVSHTIYNQDISDFLFGSTFYSLALIARQRLDEMTEDGRRIFLNRCKANVRYLLVYDYTGNQYPLEKGFSRIVAVEKPGFFASLLVPYVPEAVAKQA